MQYALGKMKCVCHQIAGVVFRTEHDMFIPRLYEKPYSLFEVPAETPHDALFCFSQDPYQGQSQRGWNIERLPREVFRELSVSRSFDSSDGGSDARSFVQMDEDQIVLTDFNHPKLTAILRPTVYGHPAGTHVAANMALSYAAMLPLFGAMSIHCGGIIRHGKALLLVAPDGGGKTTAIQLSQESPILHDDQVVLRRVGKTVIAYATPFGRMTSGPNSAEVGALLLLRKARAFSVCPASKHEILRCLWSDHRSILPRLPHKEKRTAFDLLSYTSFHVPAFVLRFPKDYIDWDAVDRAMHPQ
jgi:hypothetical protein